MYTANLKFFVETLLHPDLPYEFNMFIGIDFAF